MPRCFLHPVFRGLPLLLLILPLAVGEAGGAEPPTVRAKFPGIEFGILGSARAVPMDEGTLLTGDGFKISHSDLEAAVRSQDPQLRPHLERNLLFFLDQIAARRVLLAEAKKSGVPSSGGDGNRLIGELLERKSANVSVSEEEARAFYRANRDLVSGAPYEQAKDHIRQYLLQGKKNQLIVSYVSSLGNSARLRVNDGWLERHGRIALDNPVDKARASGKPTMVEFGATGCIPCDRMQPILEKLRKDYPGRLNVVFVHMRNEPFLTARYGIRSIPVQAFFDQAGKEVFRHEGFFPEPEVLGQLDKMGVSR